MVYLRESVLFSLVFLVLVGIIESSSRVSSSDALYEEAFRIRTQLTSSKLDLRKAGSLLLKASGLTYDQLKHPSPLPANLTLPSGILRELSFALESGHGVPRNEFLAFQFIRRAAELGDPTAHGEMFLHHSFGFHQEDNYQNGRLAKFHESDMATGLIHGTFGALGNDTVSLMSLGYRHMIGHGVPRNCPSAVAYYNAVAEKVIELAKSPGNLPVLEKMRLSSRHSHGGHRMKVEQWLQYYQYSADLGDVEAQTAVGQIYNQGSHGVGRDYSKAFYYFKQAAEAGDGRAMGHLGHMYANGLSVEPNNKTAIEWFTKATQLGNSEGQYGLGYMYLTGYGVDKNYKSALEYFIKAANQEHPEAQFHLGVMHLKGLYTRVSPVKALAFFTAATHKGHLLAMYNLAMMHVSGSGIEPNCNSALALLKQIAEHGPWSMVLQQAHNAFSEGDYTFALVSYLRAAQLGLELGQSNAAWMLEHGLAPGRLSENIHLALKLYKWSAEQENTNSLLAVGDVFYYGRGIDKDWNRSSGIYQLAEKQRSSRAAFNLGFMHQFGAGLPKDLHLARRYYDLAREYNPDAFYTSFLSLTYLRIHEWWEAVRSFVPGAIGQWIDVLFTCKYENATRVPSGWWSGRRESELTDPGKKTTVGKVMEYLDIDEISDNISAILDLYSSDDFGDLLESLFLGGLIIAFLLVYRRRYANRLAARRERNAPANQQNNNPPINQQNNNPPIDQQNNSPPVNQQNNNPPVNQGNNNPPVQPAPQDNAQPAEDE